MWKHLANSMELSFGPCRGKLRWPCAIANFSDQSDLHLFDAKHLVRAGFSSSKLTPAEEKRTPGIRRKMHPGLTCGSVTAPKVFSSPRIPCKLKLGPDPVIATSMIATMCSRTLKYAATCNRIPEIIGLDLLYQSLSVHALTWTHT